MNFKYTIPLMAMMCLVGCGNDKPAETTSAQTSSAQSQPATVSSDTQLPTEYVSPLPNSAPIYSVSMIDYTPFSFQNEYGKATGYDVDLIRAIGEEAGFKVQVKQVPFSDFFTSIQEGRADLAMSGASLTPERQEIMLASNPYSQGKPGYMVKSKSPYQTLEQLKDKKISTLENSSLHDMLKKQGTAQLELSSSMFLSVQSMFTGESDAAFGMQPSLIYTLEEFPEQKVNFVAYADPVLTAIYAGKDKQDKMVKVNEGLAKIKANGKYHQITEKWFGKNASEIEIN